MHAFQAFPLGLASLALAAAATIATTTTLTISIPASHHLPNPNALHASTSGTLTQKSSSLDNNGVLSAPLSVINTLVFRNISAGSYLLDVSCGTHAFVPLRVDVFPSASSSNDKLQPEDLEVRAWETYRGNDWNNKGEAVPIRSTGAAGGVLEARVMGPKAYFLERPAFNVLSIFKNPMILLGLVSMGIFFGMPYLVNNLDPEMKAEYEERQKKNPVNSLLSGASGGQTPSPMGNFDMAAYLAGSGQSKGKK